MKTKHVIAYALMLLMVSVTACKYDDGELWDKVNSLDQRLNNVETQLNKLNTDLSSISSLVSVLEGNILVSSVTEKDTKDGYVITFSDGKTATISNGQNGANGQDAPVMGIEKDTDGKYYWTQTVNGTKTWLTDDSGNKLRVAGEDAITPRLKVSTTGNWMVSYDNGQTYEDVKDANGNAVQAVGQNGQNGQNGDSFFSSVTQSGNKLILTLTDGTVLEVPAQAPAPAFLALSQNLGDQIDYAILGQDGTSYLYEAQDANPTIPARVSINQPVANPSTQSYVLRDVVTPTQKQTVINFNDEGLPINIISDDYTIVLGDHNNNTFKAVVISNGESVILEDLTINGITWDEYKAQLTAQTAASGTTFIQYTNLIVTTVVSTLTTASATITTQTIQAVLTTGIAIIDSESAFATLAEDAEWMEENQDEATVANMLQNYIDIPEDVTGANGIIAYFEQTVIVQIITTVETIVEDNQDDINLGEGSLISGNGEIKITLTWDNYSDIDLHCIDPTGAHIYYANQRPSGSNGFLDIDNTIGFGTTHDLSSEMLNKPENIYFSEAPAGTYKIYLHYYSSRYSITSVNYKVVIFKNSIGKTYEGIISGVDTVEDIETFEYGNASARSVTPAYTIDWNNLPSKH